MSTLIGVCTNLPDVRVPTGMPIQGYSSWGEDTEFKVRFFKEYLGKHQLPYKGKEKREKLFEDNSCGIRQVLVEKNKSLSLLAVECSESVVKSSLGSGDGVQGFIICHSSMDHDAQNNESTALHFQTVFSEARLTFSLSSQDGNNFFTSLKVVHALQATETAVQNVVIAAAERWPEPFPRFLGNTTHLSDGAAAALFSQTNDESGWHLQDVLVKSVIGFPDPWEYCERKFDSTPYSFQMKKILTNLLRNNGLSVSDINSVVPPHLNLSLVNEVNQQCGFTPEQLFMEGFGHQGYFCSADPIVRLSNVINNLKSCSENHTILLWGLGLSGHFGCALFKYVEGFSADDSR